MATAKQPGGLYYDTNGVARDGNGAILKDAPEIGKDTDPSKQPGASGAPSVEERVAVAAAVAVANAMRGGAPAAPAPKKAAAKQAEADDDSNDGEQTQDDATGGEDLSHADAATAKSVNRAGKKAVRRKSK